MTNEFTREEIARIDAALRAMRSLDRNIFLVWSIDKMSYDEIARHTGLTSKQVRKRVTRVMLRLQRVQDGESPRWWWRLF